MTVSTVDSELLPMASTWVPSTFQNKKISLRKQNAAMLKNGQRILGLLFHEKVVKAVLKQKGMYFVIYVVRKDTLVLIVLN